MLGVPLGGTFSFLIAASVVNEMAPVLLAGLFGWQVAGPCLLSGLMIAMVSGIVIGRLRLERHVEAFGWQVRRGGADPAAECST